MTLETTQTENSVSGQLLTIEERSACEILAEGDSLQSRRAQALLALDEGATHKDAGEQAGLTPGQVNYWLRKFRHGRMTIYPEAEPTPAAAPAPPSAERETAVAPATETKADQSIVFPDKKPKKVKKKKKATKNAKKPKKEKKVKPTKKAKKSSKKSKKSAKPNDKGEKKKSDKKPKKTKKKSGKKSKKKK